MSLKTNRVKVLGSFSVIVYHTFYGEYSYEKRERINGLNVCRRIWRFEGRIGNLPFLLKFFYGESIYTAVEPQKANIAKVYFIIQFVLEFVVEIIDTIKGYKLLSNILRSNISKGIIIQTVLFRCNFFNNIGKWADNLSSTCSCIDDSYKFYRYDWKFLILILL